jgi:hypothetical protein
MDRLLLRGERVRLAAINPETDAEASAHWTRDTEYWRLNTTDPASPWTARSVKEFMERSFIHEGRLRQVILREGRRWDMLYMGILRAEWESGIARSTST